jgi:NAD(P)-dependent dehydrogenase (short-subunit alcohol dehydrogenase family)
MAKWTVDDIGDQSGRTVLITGANSGIGFAAAKELAEHGADVVLGCRNRAKADDAVAEIEAAGPRGSVEVLEMDLADLDSVAAAAERFAAGHDRLDILVNNAGVMALPRTETPQGFEMQFGVNHLGHYAFAGRLLPMLLDTEGSRLVVISSIGHRSGRMNFDDLQGEQSYNRSGAYFQSKLANLLYMNELQRRLDEAGESTIVTAAHPGISTTNLTHGVLGGWVDRAFRWTAPVTNLWITQPPEGGALPTLRAATDPDADGGDYFGPDGFQEFRGGPVKVSMTKAARDLDDAARLWEMSQELTGVTYPV